MIDYFLNVMMYLVILLLMMKYFSKFNLYSFMIVLFNMNVFFLFLYININFINGLVISIISILLYEFFRLFKKKHDNIILIRDGNVNFHELINTYSYYELLNYLKRHKISLDEVAYCIKKNGRLTVIKNNEISGYPISIIVDGNLMKENLKLIHKNEVWLKEELLKKHLLISTINYAYYKNNQIYFVTG